MPTQLYHAPFVLRRMRKSCLGHFFDDYIHYLQARGHPIRGIKRYCGVIEHLGYWLAKENMTVRDLSIKAIERFKQHLPHCHCPEPHDPSLIIINAALQHFLNLCQTKNICKPIPLKPPYHHLLTEFINYLHEVCNLSTARIASYEIFIAYFLKTSGINCYKDIKYVTAKQVKKFFLDYTASYKVSTAQNVAGMLRLYFKFLQFKKLSVSHLIWAIPHLRKWSLAHVPSCLSLKQIKRLLKSFDRQTPIGKRDYAIACCFVCLGLRRGEIAALKLDDIYWQEKVIVLPQNKSQRVMQLPLPPLLLDALIDYIKAGRVKTDSRAIFVYHRPPIGKGIQPGTISQIIQRTLQRSNLPLVGTHIFRRTLASRMLQKGATLKEISDVLRHRNINTSMIYTKIDLKKLRRVSMPWVGEFHG